MTGITHRPWAKTARLYRDITITEKIDGTNAAVGIVPLDDLDIEVTSAEADEDGRFNVELAFENADYVLAVVEGLAVYAQSRNRLIRPGADNAGFAAWVQENAEGLVHVLGKGLHYGEWWGNGIQRGYGLPAGERRFSLFNTDKLDAIDATYYDGSVIEGLDVVPTLYEGPFSERAIASALDYLREWGSDAEFGYDKPEGIVIYHTASRTGFKVLLESDDLPKSLVAATGVAA